MKRDLAKTVREPGFWFVGACALPVVCYSAIGSSFLWIGLFAGFWFILLTLLGLAWVLWSRPPWYLPTADRRWFRLRRLRMVALWALILLSVPTTRWPLRLSFFIAQPALNDMADQIQRGEKLHLPQRVGLIVIRDAGMFNEFGRAEPVPYLWIADYGTSVSAAGFRRDTPSPFPASDLEHRFASPVEWLHLMGNWFQADED